MSNIRFQILPPIARPDEPVFISGSVPALGDWETGSSLRLEWKPPYHIGEIEADTGAGFEYKIHRGTWEQEAVDARGEVPGNFSHSVWLNATVHHTVADWKDRYRGRLTHEKIHSRVLAGSRDVLIWLPHSYSTDLARRFPLIVLHDGANVFDPLTSPLSGVDWAADEWVNRLSAEGVMPEAIVVGVCHPEGFSEENESLRDYDLTPQLGGGAYAQFVATDLIAHMDTHYRTQATPSSRTLGGAALGGLLTFYIAVQHPGVFGNFICLSTPLEGIVEALPADARMYFGYGTKGLDEAYESAHTELARLLEEKGWKSGEQFQIARTPGAGHDELAWRQQLGEALRWLAR